MSHSIFRDISHLPTPQEFIENLPIPSSEGVKIDSGIKDVDAAILVFNDNELQAALRFFEIDKKVSQKWAKLVCLCSFKFSKSQTTTTAKKKILLVNPLEQGSWGPSGSYQVVGKVIRNFLPRSIFGIGCAYGVGNYDENCEQSFLDIIASSRIAPYERVRQGSTTQVNRNKSPEVSVEMCTRIKSEAGSFNDIHVGAILSGDKLVDNEHFRDVLIDLVKNGQKKLVNDHIVGGEMEAIGIYDACNNERIVPCAIIKGISDFGKGKKEVQHQDVVNAIRSKIRGDVVIPTKEGENLLQRYAAYGSLHLVQRILEGDQFKAPAIYSVPARAKAKVERRTIIEKENPQAYQAFTDYIRGAEEYKRRHEAEENSLTQEMAVLKQKLDSLLKMKRENNEKLERELSRYEPDLNRLVISFSDGQKSMSVFRRPLSQSVKPSLATLRDYMPPEEYNHLMENERKEPMIKYIINLPKNKAPESDTDSAGDDSDIGLEQDETRPEKRSRNS